MVKLESSSRSQIRARSCQCMTTMIRKTKEAYQKNKKQKKKKKRLLEIIIAHADSLPLIFLSCKRERAKR
jgi:hypothetical protein